MFVNVIGPDFRKRHGADGNRSVSKPCDLDKVRQEALKTLFSKSSLDAAALKRHLRHCVFSKDVRVSVGPEAEFRFFLRAPGGRNGWLTKAQETYVQCGQRTLKFKLDRRPRLAGHCSARPERRDVLQSPRNRIVRETAVSRSRAAAVRPVGAGDVGQKRGARP